MKKLLLSLGTVAAIAAPVASVIACGSTPTSTKKTTSALTKAINELNVKLAAAVKATVDAAIADDPTVGAYTETNSVKLVAKNAADWKIEIKVVTEGFGKTGSGLYTPTKVAADARIGYDKEFTKPMLSYKDASMGLPIAIELNDAGIEKFFANYAHGGLSLGNTETGADKTAFKTSQALVKAFATKFATELA